MALGMNHEFDRMNWFLLACAKKGSSNFSILFVAIHFERLIIQNGLDLVGLGGASSSLSWQGFHAISAYFLCTSMFLANLLWPLIYNANWIKLLWPPTPVAIPCFRNSLNFWDSTSFYQSLTFAITINASSQSGWKSPIATITIITEPASQLTLTFPNGREEEIYVYCFSAAES